MRKFLALLFLFLSTGSLSAMVRAGVEVGPEPAPYYYEQGWYGPGYYYGVYYTDYPTYYAWRRQYYYGGPYYYRSYYNHHGRYDRRYYRHHH